MADTREAPVINCGTDKYIHECVSHCGHLKIASLSWVKIDVLFPANALFAFSPSSTAANYALLQKCHLSQESDRFQVTGEEGEKPPASLMGHRVTGSPPHPSKAD